MPTRKRPPEGAPFYSVINSTVELRCRRWNAARGKYGGHITLAVHKPRSLGEFQQRGDYRNRRAPFCLTSKMSHDLRWRDSCSKRAKLPCSTFGESYHSTRRDRCGRWL